MDHFNFHTIYIYTCVYGKGFATSPPKGFPELQWYVKEGQTLSKEEETQWKKKSPQEK